MLYFVPATISKEALAEALAQLFRSPQFASSQRRCDLLRYIIQEHLESRSNAITEYSLGLDVFRKTKDFDPRVDPIVRVEVNRLRQRLREYYAAHQDAGVVIEIPIRSYVPVLTAREEPAPQTLPPAGNALEIEPAVPVGLLSRRMALWAAGAMVAITLLTVSWLTLRTKEPSSVAVLPFLDLSAAHEREYVADGFTDEITAAVSNVPGLRVAARTSAFTFKRRQDDIRTIAHKLNVDAVVEGSILYSGDRVRVTAQLERASDGFHMWSQTFEGDSQDLFRLEGEIASGIAGALRTNRAQNSLRRTAPPVPIYVQNAYLKGRYFWNKRSGTSVRKAAGYFEEAIRVAPDFALAHAALADCYIILANNDQEPAQEMVSKAAAEARRALELDPTRGEPHAVLAQLKFYRDWDWTGALAEYDRAIELSPNYATAHHWKALAFTWLGRFSAAAEEIRRAQSLDPLSPVIAGTSSVVEYYARRYDKAADLAKRALELDDSFYFPHYMIGLCCARQKKYPEALTQLREAVRLSSESETIMYLAHTLAKAGDRNGATNLLGQLQNPSPDLHVSRYQLAFVNAGLGQRRLALDHLEAALANREPDMVMLKVEPVLDELRAEPRFVRIMSALRFP